MDSVALGIIAVLLNFMVCFILLWFVSLCYKELCLSLVFFVLGLIVLYIIVDCSVYFVFCVGVALPSGNLSDFFFFCIGKGAFPSSFC